MAAQMSGAGETGGNGAAGRARTEEGKAFAEAAWFPYPPSKPVRLIPPIALAYLGDAVYEAGVRQFLLSLPSLKPNHLHKAAIRLVSAKAQSRILAHLEPELTDEERDVVRQGRNAKSGSVPKNADVLEYRHATAFECLLGYLYYCGAQERIQQLVHSGIMFMHNPDSTQA